MFYNEKSLATLACAAAVTYGASANEGLLPISTRHHRAKCEEGDREESLERDSHFNK